MLSEVDTKVLAHCRMAKTYLAVVEEVILRAYSVVQQLTYNLYSKPIL